MVCASVATVPAPCLYQVKLRSAHRCGSRCQGGHHSYLANDQARSEALDRFAGSGTHSAAATAAATATSAASVTAPARSCHEGNTDKGVSGDGVLLSPGRRRRGGGWNEGGYFRGDHYCRVRVGQKGLPSTEGEVRGVSIFFVGGVFRELYCGCQVAIRDASATLEWPEDLQYINLCFFVTSLCARDMIVCCTLLHILHLTRISCISACEK